MTKEQLKGVKWIIAGVVILAGYFGYLLYEIRSGAQQISVSMKLPAIMLILIAVGVIQAIIGEKTMQLMSFDTRNLSRKDILILFVVGGGAVVVFVAMTLFLNSQGYY